MTRSNRAVRIAVIVALMALTLVSVIGIASSATDTTPTVISKNVSYGSELYLYYAVEAASIPSGETPSLGVYGSDGETLKYKVTEYTTENVLGKMCYVFRTVGTSPKDINTPQYVRALSSGGSRGELVSYSIQQYLYDRLYSEGYATVSPSAGKNYTRRTLYYDLLKYASTAQRLLMSSELAAGKVEPIGAITYLGMCGGSYVGICNEGDTATVTYTGTPPVNMELDGFTVATYSTYGELISSYTAELGDTVVASGITCVYPNYKVKSFETLIVNGSTVAILAEDAVALEAAEALETALTPIVGAGNVLINPKSTSLIDNIIVISNGDDAPNSVAALAALESSSMYREARFAVYAHDGRIEISYDENEYTTIQLLPYAIAEFIDEYISGDSVHFLPNTTITTLTDLIEKQEAIDAEFIASQWADAEAKAITLYGETNGKAIIESLKGYYSMFKPDLIDWYANLYDPGIGGYYVTTSGKTYSGFLPTLESTRQGLDFLLNSGMIKQLGANWTKVLPETMKAQVIYYVLSLQNSNGYFYNPQMTKAQTDAAISRRGRDLSWGIRLLGQAGVAPIYATPTGGAGQQLLGMTPDQWWATTGIDEAYKPYVPTSLEDYDRYLTSQLSESTATAVSRVILTASDSSTAYLESYSAFAAYLDSKNIDAYPYSVGNELNATYSQIKAFSDQLLAESGACPAGISSSGGISYEGMSMQQMLLAWIEAHINDNGLFGDDGNGEADDYRFANTNGFFKIISIYTNWGVAYPAPIEATNGLLNCLRSDEKSTTNICEVYNAWNALSSLKSNVKNYASDSVRDTVLGNITSYIGEYGRYAIDTTTEKQSGYQKEDGSFSHRYIGSVTSHQGNIPVGVGANEGNVDAIGFGVTGTPDSMFAVLELPTVYKYTEADFMRYLEILLKAEPVREKQAYVADSKKTITDFEGNTLDDYAGITDVSTSATNGNTYGIVVEDENAEFINHVLEIKKPASGTDTNAVVKQSCTAAEMDADVAVLEFKFKAVDLAARLELQITLGSSGSSPIVVVGYSSGYYNYARIYINSTSNYTTARIGQWVTIRLEYRVTEITDGAVTGIECRTYVNDALASTVNTIRSGKTAPTVAGAQQFNISVNNANIGTFYFDDLSFTKKKSES